MEIHIMELALQFYGGNFMGGSDIEKNELSYKFRESFALRTLYKHRLQILSDRIKEQLLNWRILGIIYN